MAFGEYLTVVNDYNSRSTTKNVSSGLQNQLSTTLCKEKVRLKNVSRPKPQTPLEELLLWRLSIPSSED